MSIVLLGIGATIAALMMNAVLIAPKDLRTTTLEVPLAGLASTFDGYTIVVISDVHHWGLGSRYLRRIVRAANAANPDLIALLGDYAASFEHNHSLSAMVYRRAFPSLIRALGELRAHDGLVGVLGNHDHYFDGAQVADWLRGVGVRILVNDHVVLRRSGARLVIGGVGDAQEDRVDPRGGVDDQPPGTAIVVLCHNPDGVYCLDADSGIGLVLSGHTHGGQVVLPGYGALTTHTRICGRRTASGWVPNAKVPLYVTRGVGAQTSVRFRCPPELLILRLRVENQQPA